MNKIEEDLKRMKRKLSACLLSLCLLASLLAVPTRAVGQNSAIQATKALGIISGDDTNATVTRAQLAVMLTAASSYKDSVSAEGVGYSLYKDVKSGYWASEYIRLAVQEGWMSGYTDGTFRPDQAVTLEEACTAALKLLGYDSASLAGSFPYAQLNKASAVGLRDQITKQKGQTLTVGDCAQLFYNLLTAKNSGGQVYGTTLGYTVTNGGLDYTSVIAESVSGPYIAGSEKTSLPFTPSTVYRNGEASGSAALKQYDVYYYNASSGTLWIYTGRVSGEVTALSPSSTSPTSVTVSDQTYSIAGGDAAYQLSELGGGGVGSYVTLLLGMNGVVASVLTGDDVNGLYYGLIQSSTRLVDNDDGASVETQVQILCTDGAVRTFTVPLDALYNVGQLVSVNITQNGTKIGGMSQKSVDGKVNSSATKLGDIAFAENVQILDTSEEGDGARIEPERLAGVTLSRSDVRWCGLNTAGEIEYLILNDVTGDTWDYGYLSHMDDQSEGLSIKVNYTYIVDGVTTNINSSTTRYFVKSGGIAIRYSTSNSIKSMKQLGSAELTALNGQTAVAINQRYTISDHVQVYLLQNGVYYLTDLSAVDTENYTLTGWYDDLGCMAGKQIRVIIARPK